jgi:hypothetical protein
VSDTYVQRLDAIGLAIERATDRTPDTKQYYVYKADELIGSFRRLPEAQKLFARLRKESGWKPRSKPDLSPQEMLSRERELHQRIAYMEYWSQSHRFRGGGRPKRR